MLRLQLMAAEHKERIGARIRDARDAKGWTQAELARALPGTVDGPSVSRWERGKVSPHPETLEAIATALDVDVSYFLVAAPKAGTPDLMGALNGNQQDRLDRLQAVVEENARKLDEILALLHADPGGELGETFSEEDAAGPAAAAA